MVNFLYFLGTFLYSFVLICCYNKTLDNPKTLQLKDWIIIFLLSSIMVINNLYSNINFKLLYSIILTFIFFYLIFREKSFKLFCKIIFICIISILIDFILSIFLTIVVPNFSILNTNYLLKIGFTILCCYVLFFIFKIKYTIYFYRKVENMINQNRNIIFIGVLTLIVIGYNYYIYMLNFREILFYAISMGLISFLTILVYIYFKEIYHNKSLELKNKYLVETLELVKDTFNDYRDLKHNMFNDFLFIKSLSNKKTQNLIDIKMEKYYKDYEIVDILKDVQPGFQGLIYIKARLAKKYNVYFNMTNVSNFDYKKLPHRTYIDLYEILSIVLDNAIEAAKEADKKIVLISAKQITGGVLIEIVNTFSNEIDLNKLGEKNYSTKNRDSGLGLNYIYKLNKNIQIESEVIHHLFKITIILKQK